MSHVIRAVFEGGVFRPIGPVELPEHSVVEFEPRPVGAVMPDEPRRSAAKDAIYEILSRRYEGDDPEVAARHNEHQP